MRRVLHGLLESVPFLLVALVATAACGLVVVALADGNWNALWAAPFAALVLLVGVANVVEWWDER